MTERDEVRSALATATRLRGELRPRADAAVLIRTRARRQRRQWATAGATGMAGCLVAVAVVLATSADESRTTLPPSGSTPTATSPTPMATSSTQPPFVMWPPGPRTFSVPIEFRSVIEAFPDGTCPAGDDTMPVADDTVPATEGTGCYRLDPAAMEIRRVRDLSTTLATGPSGTTTDGITLVLILSESDARAWASLTELSVNKQVALAVDGRVYYAPVVAERSEGGMISVPLGPAATTSLLAALGVSTGQTDPALVPDSALAQLRGAIDQLMRVPQGALRPTSARLVDYRIYRWGTSEDFTLLVTLDLRFPTRNTAAWNEGRNTRFVTFTKRAGDSSYRLDWRTSP